MEADGIIDITGYVSILSMVEVSMACSSSSSILLSALEQVTQDPSFQTSSPVAGDALQAAKHK